jgi:hypothetical protein
MLTLDWFWFWQKPNVDFVTPFSIEECQSRLANALYFRRRLFGVQTKNPVIGEIESNQFYLTKAPSWFKDDFRPFLYGNLITTEKGTRIRASFRIQPGITLFGIVGIGLFFILSLGDALKTQDVLWSLLTLAIFWIIMLSLWGVFIWLGSWSKKSNREFLANYLRQTLLPRK